MTRRRTPVRTPHQRELRDNLRFCLADGVGFSVMVGLGETYLAAFALALGMGEIYAGLLSTLPLLAGALIQLISPVGVRWMGSRKRWVVVCAALQSASFLPLVVGSVIEECSGLLLMATASLYWAAGLGTGPAWNSWIELLVPHRIRARFFARRSSYTHLALLIGILAGGFLLQTGHARGFLFPAFALIFSLAAGSRVFSSLMLSKQTEPAGGEGRKDMRLRDSIGNIAHGRHGAFLVYLLAVQLAVSIASPFFTPYMLKGLRLTYAEYTMLLAAAFLAKMGVLILIGKRAKGWGTMKLLRIGGIGIIPMSILWLVSGSFTYLFVLQIFSGSVWACYELAVFLLIFERIPVHERTAVLTIYNVGHAVFTVAGSLIGAGIFGMAGPVSAYGVIFIASFAARLLTLPLQFRLGPFPVISWSVIVRAVAVRPSAGPLWKPLVGGFSPPREKEGPHDDGESAAS